MKIGKYEFISEEQANKKIKDLGVETSEDGVEYPTHSHAVVTLGHIVVQEGTYDENGDVITEPVLSEKYHVDVMWDGLDSHPYGWASYAVVPSDEGLHSFLGIDYQEYKL